jgi:hypothetical protein
MIANHRCGTVISEPKCAQPSHGAQSRNRRSHQDQGKQESGVSRSQRSEDGGLTAEHNALSMCPVSESWRGIFAIPSLVTATGASACRMP